MEMPVTVTGMEAKARQRLPPAEPGDVSLSVSVDVTALNEWRPPVTAAAEFAGRHDRVFAVVGWMPVVVQLSHDED